MYQVKESWSSRSQAERDEMTDKEEEQKIISLVKKYGRKKVSDAEDEARKERKNRLKKGEVKVWDKQNNKWVSNKDED